MHIPRRLFRWLNDTHIAPVFTEIALGSALFLIIPVSIYAATYQLGAPGVSITGSITVPDPVATAAPYWPDRYHETFDDGIGYWTTPSGVGGPRSVTNGVFRSYDWGYDNNHTPAGMMLHLLAFADWQYWNYQKLDGSWVLSDFTNASINARVRGVNFDPKGSQFILWVTSRHPTAPGEITNWAYVGEPRTPALLDGEWHDIHWDVSPDPSKWSFGMGHAGGIYDTFLPIDEALRNVYNVHMLMMGPVDVQHPTGSFELDTFEVVFNRNGPRPTSLNAQVNIIPLMTGPTTGGVTLSGGGNYAPWTIASYATLDGSTFQQWNSTSGFVDVELSSPRRPTKYAMTARPGTPTYAPKSWQVLCHTGSAWVTLDTQTNVPTWGGGERREYTAAIGPELCTKVRFNITQSQGGTYLQWVRPELFALPL